MLVQAQAEAEAVAEVRYLSYKFLILLISCPGYSGGGGGYGGGDQGGYGVLLFRKPWETLTASFFRRGLSTTTRGLRRRLPRWRWRIWWRTRWIWRSILSDWRICLLLSHHKNHKISLFSCLTSIACSSQSSPVHNYL